MSASPLELQSKNKLWLSQKIILGLSLFLCISAAIAIGVLYRYINIELNYVNSILALQKNYSAAFPRLLDMQLTQQNFIQNKNPIDYNHFLELQTELNNINHNINNIINISPELENCAGAFVTALNNEANNFKENMDVAKKFNINKTISLNDYINHFSKIIKAFIDKENTSLQLHNKAINRIKALFILSGLIFLFSIIIFTYAICTNFINDIKILNSTKNKLNELNAELEYKVSQRTNDLENARLYAEKERQRVELLLQDTSHRIGNSLATVASLLGIQARRATNLDVTNALNSARDRIQTIAAAHRRLRLGSDMETTKVNEFLQAVIHDIEFSMPSSDKKRIGIISELHNFSCASRDATTLGIVMGELLTNAIKHAFPPPNSGEIHIFFGKKADDKLYLIIKDNGIGVAPIDNENNKQGLGLLVAKQLCMQFNTEPTYEIHNGTQVTIDLSSIVLSE